LHSGKLPFIIEGEIKIFHDKQKLMELMTTKPALQKIKESCKQKKINIT
jgi:hypothetical protein